MLYDFNFNGTTNAWTNAKTPHFYFYFFKTLLQMNEKFMLLLLTYFFVATQGNLLTKPFQREAFYITIPLAGFPPIYEGELIIKPYTGNFTVNVSILDFRGCEKDVDSAISPQARVRPSNNCGKGYLYIRTFVIFVTTNLIS